MVKIDSNLNSAKYTQLLKIFRHEGVLCHKLRATQQNSAEEGDAILKDWSAQSPDFNFIEQMWTELKRRVRQMNPQNLEELWKLVGIRKNKNKDISKSLGIPRNP